MTNTNRILPACKLIIIIINEQEREKERERGGRLPVSDNIPDKKPACLAVELVDKTQKKKPLQKNVDISALIEHSPLPSYANLYLIDTLYKYTSDKRLSTTPPSLTDVHATRDKTVQAIHKK